MHPCRCDHLAGIAHAAGHLAAKVRALHCLVVPAVAPALQSQSLFSTSRAQQRCMMCVPHNHTHAPTRNNSNMGATPCGLFRWCLRGCWHQASWGTCRCASCLRRSGEYGHLALHGTAFILHGTAWRAHWGLVHDAAALVQAGVSSAPPASAPLAHLCPPPSPFPHSLPPSQGGLGHGLHPEPGQGQVGEVLHHTL